MGESIAFSVSGEFLTKMARDLVLEGRWERSLQFLEESLGCGMTIAIDIASGKTSLIGEGTYVDTEDEDPEVRLKYEKLVRWYYRGRFETSLAGGRSWIRPVAYVTNYGPGDLTRMPQWQYQEDVPLSCGIHIVQGSIQPRDPFYCQHQGEWSVGGAPVQAFNGQVAPIICEMCPSPPIWLERIKSLKDAVHDFESRGGELEERGWKQYQDRYEYPQPLKYDGVRIMHVDVDVDEQQAAADEKWSKHISHLVKLREDILRKIACNQDPDKWFTFTKKWKGERWEGMEIQVPRDAFMYWAFQNRDKPSLNVYKPISESGLRLPNDVPAHTDWLLGATLFPFSETAFEQWKPWEHFDELTKMGYTESYEQHNRVFHTDITVLSTGQADYVEGKIVHPKRNEIVDYDCIAVIPNASPDYIKACTAKAVITEVGGSFAHLVIASTDTTIIRVEDALTRYPVGSIVMIDLVGRTVSLMENVAKESDFS